MQVAIVVILLSLCASLALPVPLDKSDQRREDREEREISAEELERELEDIENRISSVRTKVKEESRENKENLETTKGTPLPSSTKTSVERKTDTEAQTTAGNVKTTEGVHIIVEKETSPTHTSKPTEPTTTPKTPISTEKTPLIVKVEVEQEQKTSGAEKKLQEEDKGKSEGVVAVEKVTEEEEEKEQTAEEPKSIKVVKVANDETGWDEEADLESGKTGGNEKPMERVGNAAVTTPVKTEEIGITVEKITPSPKSPTKSTQSEVVKVERVPSKQNVETKRSFVERIEEDEDLKVGGEAQSPDGEEKIEVTVEKESTETSRPAKESSSAKEIVIGVERVSPATDETDEEVKKVEVIAKPTKTKEMPISQGNVDKVSISVEKMTPSPKSPTKSTQSEVVKVERVPSKQNVETKRSFVERIKEDEDLKVGGEAQSPDGEEKIEVTVEKESTETFPAKESSSAKEIVIGVERVPPATDETDEEVKKVEVIAKPTVKPTTTKELKINQGNVDKVSISVEKITPSPKSPTKSTQSEVVKVERVSSKQSVETKRNFVERIEEDEDLNVGAGEAQSPDGEETIEVTVEKKSKETSPAKESSSAKEIIVEVKKVSPATDKTDEETKPTVKPTTTKELPISQANVEKVSISVEKITPSQSPSSGKPQTSMVRKVVKVTTTEEEDLETSQDAVNYKRSDDVSEKTSDSEEEALELELEGGQDKMNTEKDKVDEQKLAEEFDKALEAERNGKGDGIDKQLEKLNVEAAPQKVEVRKVMSDEERELAELAEETMNDEDKEEVKPTKNPTTATSQEVVTKVEKVSKVTVQVTKEQTAKLPLNEEETAKEEKKLKVELENELQQEKEEQEREAELESSDTDAKSKRAASISQNDHEAQLENLLAM